MMRRYGYGKSFGAFHAPGTLYARAKTAAWLGKILEQKVPLESNFFYCLGWVAGDLRRPLQAMMREAEKLGKPGVLLRKAIREASESPCNRLDGELEALYERHPSIAGIIRDVAARECGAANKACGKPVEPYSVALKRLEQTFGLNEECRTLCEFLFINQSFSAVERYFEDTLEVHQFGNRSILAHILDMTQARLQACRAELGKYGLFNADRFRLQDCLLPFWETSGINTEELFSRPLSGAALPLESFHVAPEDAAHVKKLLEQAGKAPVHILLYGAPGTGKSAFAHSLAQACGVKAWAVISREDDDDKDRRASLTACLHLAGGHTGAFVLVDEAERLLDTGGHSGFFGFFSSGGATKDKAWLNDFLERPGQRIIWTTNQVEHIDPAVRRRFSFSIHFEKLGVRERTAIWRQVAVKHRVAQRLGDEQIKALAHSYPVEAAVITGAVAQAKSLYKGKAEFFAALERILRSQTSLQRDGRKQGIKPQAVSDFTLDGVCMEGSAAGLAEKCRRIDAAMRKNASLRPGCATMLFYGPPGTGKTALARYLAKELDRECMVERASDLRSPWVGVTEQQIAGAFARAEREGAVLVIDEADSFLYSRDTAVRSWETSFVNEFLTALEECRCFCICTTNRRDDLDSAAMRRFSYKLAFTYAGQEQVKALYAGLLAPLCAEPLPVKAESELLRLNRLTPGDFHAVRSRYDSLFTDASELSHEILVDALAQEQLLKTDQQTCRIGFGV